MNVRMPDYVRNKRNGLSVDENGGGEYIGRKMTKLELSGKRSGLNKDKKKLCIIAAQKKTHGVSWCGRRRMQCSGARDSLWST